MAVAGCGTLFNLLARSRPRHLHATGAVPGQLSFGAVAWRTRACGPDPAATRRLRSCGEPGRPSGTRGGGAARTLGESSDIDCLSVCLSVCLHCAAAESQRSLRSCEMDPLLFETNWSAPVARNKCPLGTAEVCPPRLVPFCHESKTGSKTARPAQGTARSPIAEHLHSQPAW